MTKIDDDILGPFPLAEASFCHIVRGDLAAPTVSLFELLRNVLRGRAITIHLGLLGARMMIMPYVFGRLCPNGACSARAALPGGVERFSWTAAGGNAVRAWVSTSGLAEHALTTLLLTDVPVNTDYILWCHDCRQMEPKWRESLPAQLGKKVDYFGCPSWVEYSPNDIERLQCRPWYRGVPLERRNGRAGVSFMNGFWGLRTACMKEIESTGERNSGRWAVEQPGGWPVLLGEMAPQLGWSQAEG
jgi:hypothetical protein